MKKKKVNGKLTSKTRSLTKSSSDSDEEKVIIVGIGASAGGLEAIIDLLKSISPQTGMGFVIIQHLASSHESLTPEIFSHATSMKVQQVTDSMRVKPNNVYVIPPGYSMTTHGGVLKLITKVSGDSDHLVINSFFQSLANDLGARAIGVILSGSANDGSSGVESIKANGGIVLVQDPSTAKFKGMPKNAIATGAVDLVLPPYELGKELEQIAAHPLMSNLGKDLVDPHTFIENSKENKDEAFDVSSSISKVLKILNKHSGVDFFDYKPSTLRRRIERRMIINKYSTIDDYAKYLQVSKIESKLLFAEILIHVTNFFRDSESYIALSSKILEKQLEKRDSKKTYRVWVAGCATGEEVYSLAITLIELIESLDLDCSIQIFGTDISESVIQKARLGFYSTSIEEHVSKERLAAYFDRVENGYKIKKSIRELCLFSIHNIAGDPPFSKIDLLTCRNLLIYFSSNLQKKVFPIFHYSLVLDGVLWLGKSESVNVESSKLFSVLDKTNKIYKKIDTPSSMSINFHRHMRIPTLTNNILKSEEKLIPSMSKSKRKIIPKHSESNSKSIDLKNVSSKEKDKIIRSLQKEVIEIRDHEQLVIERFQSSQEELTSANEELQSTNEEMQSTNEELETAKEELQSTNEELNTVNEELHNRNAELTRFSSDLNNVLSSINIPLIILGNDLNIRKFTPKAKNVFKLRDGDIGRPLSEIRSDFEIDFEFDATVLEVIQTLVPFEKELKSKDERWLRLHIRPYKTIDQRIDGVVITLIDIESLKKKVIESEKALDYLTSVAESVKLPLVILDESLKLKSANRVFWSTYRINPLIVGKSFLDNFNIIDTDIILIKERITNLFTSQKKDTSEFLDIISFCDLPSLGKRKIKFSVNIIRWLGEAVNFEESPNTVLLSCEDITEE
jgi:two-component system, chemotaxis family, CheB/CheR fusion protein